MIQKGEVRNPKGRPALPPEAREVRKMTTEEIIIIGTKLFDLSIKELRKIARSQTLPVKEVALAKVLVQSIKYGDVKRLDTVFNRVVGKVKDVLELAGHVGVGIGKYDGLSLEEIRKLRIEKKAERDLILHGDSKKKKDGQRTTSENGKNKGS